MKNSRRRADGMCGWQRQETEGIARISADPRVDSGWNVLHGSPICAVRRRTDRKGRTIHLWSSTIPGSRNYVPSNYYIWPARFSRPISRMERILPRTAVFPSACFSLTNDPSNIPTYREIDGFDYPSNSNFLPLSLLFYLLLLSYERMISPFRWKRKFNPFEFKNFLQPSLFFG